MKTMNKKQAGQTILIFLFMFILTFCSSDIIEVDEEYEGSLIVGDRIFIRINEENKRLTVINTTEQTLEKFTYNKVDDNTLLYTYSDEKEYSLVKMSAEYIAMGYNSNGADDIIIATSTALKSETEGASAYQDYLIGSSYNAFIPLDRAYGSLKVDNEGNADVGYETPDGSSEFTASFTYVDNENTIITTEGDSYDLDGVIFNLAEDIMVVQKDDGDGIIILLKDYENTNAIDITGEYSLVAISVERLTGDTTYSSGTLDVRSDQSIDLQLSNLVTIDSTLTHIDGSLYSITYEEKTLLFHFVPNKAVFLMQLPEDNEDSYFYAIGN